MLSIFYNLVLMYKCWHVGSKSVYFYHSQNTAAGFQWFPEPAYEWIINTLTQALIKSCHPVHFCQFKLDRIPRLNINLCAYNLSQMIYSLLGSHMICISKLVIGSMSFFVKEYIILFSAKIFLSHNV